VSPRRKFFSFELPQGLSLVGLERSYEPDSDILHRISTVQLYYSESRVDSETIKSLTSSNKEGSLYFWSVPGRIP